MKYTIELSLLHFIYLIHILYCRDESFTNKNRFLKSVIHNTHLDDFVDASEMQNKTHDVIRSTDAELRVLEPTSIANIQRMK